MIKRIYTLCLFAFWGCLFLYALIGAFLNYLSAGRSLWWFALESLLLAGAFACLFLLDRSLPSPDLESIRGARAVVAAVVVIIVFVPAVAAGAFLDTLLGFELSLGAIVASAAVVAALRLIGARFAPAGTIQSAAGVPYSSLTSESTPPN